MALTWQKRRAIEKANAELAEIEASKISKSVIKETFKAVSTDKAYLAKRSEERAKTFNRPSGKDLQAVRATIAAISQNREILEAEKDEQHKAEIEAHRLYMLGKNIAERSLMLKKREENKQKALLRKEADKERLKRYHLKKKYDKLAKIEQLKANLISGVRPTSEQEAVAKAQVAMDEFNAERDAYYTELLRADKD